MGHEIDLRKRLAGAVTNNVGLFELRNGQGRRERRVSLATGCRFREPPALPPEVHWVDAPIMRAAALRRARFEHGVLASKGFQRTTDALLFARGNGLEHLRIAPAADREMLAAQRDHLEVDGVRLRERGGTRATRNAD